MRSDCDRPTRRAIRSRGVMDPRWKHSRAPLKGPSRGARSKVPLEGPARGFRSREPLGGTSWRNIVPMAAEPLGLHASGTRRARGQGRALRTSRPPTRDARHGGHAAVVRRSAVRWRVSHAAEMRGADRRAPTSVAATLVVTPSVTSSSDSSSSDTTTSVTTTSVTTPFEPRRRANAIATEMRGCARHVSS
ncbi:MAG: hypothetical protein RI967_254 [Planctomycetota bacterium]